MWKKDNNDYNLVFTHYEKIAKNVEVEVISILSQI